jgi:multidrug resistance efflux pump
MTAAVRSGERAPMSATERGAVGARLSAAEPSRDAVSGRVRIVRPNRDGGDASGAAGGRTRNTALQAWLEQLGTTSSNLRAADVFDVPADTVSPVRRAAWPASAGAEDAAAAALARRVVEAGRCLGAVPRSAPDVRLLAAPLASAGLPRAALVARFAANDASPRDDLTALVNAVAALRRLHGSEAAAAPQQATPAAASRAPVAPAPAKRDDAAYRETLELVVAALEHREVAAASAAVVNRLAASLRANRVCLGMWNGGAIELLAVSGSAGFDSSTALSIAVCDAMQEALSQRATLVLPNDPNAAPREDSAQRVLLRLSGGHAVCTVPFPDGASLVGAVTLEWAEAGAGDAPKRARCEAMLALVGPVLSALQRAQLGLLRRAREAAATALKRAFGPRRPVLKLALVVGIAVLALASSVSAVHRVTGNAVLRGSLQRLVTAPVDGFIATSPVRPGDVVAEGAVLATLDDHALSLEVAKWQAEYDQTLNEYREALSLLDSTKVTTLRASLDRSLAELALAEDNLARSVVRAPIAGFVVSGDLSQSLGAPIERGATLFELAPLDDYHVNVRVPEDDVGLLAPGQTGRLVLEALPGESLAIVVERVTPVSEVVDGRNVFEVEARLADSRDVLRPGMQGAAKFDVGEARLIWLWTHDIFDWLRLKLWALGLGG